MLSQLIRSQPTIDLGNHRNVPVVTRSQGADVPPLRREIPRQTIHWEGEYRIDGDEDGHWRRCRIIDVSPAGAGLELLDATPDETCGRQITVAVKLRGEVRNSRDGSEDSLRVGIQFVELTPAERDYLESVVGSQARW